MNEQRKRQVLNAGSGAARGGRVHDVLAAAEFSEVRIDIDPRTAPDIIGSFSDMRGIVEDARFDIVWSSHSVEHLRNHEVLPALREFKRVLRADGLAIITCPNIAAVAKMLDTEDIESVVYVSAAGPIRILDIIYGHSPSIEAGQAYMAHNTGFTAARLGRLAANAGFAEARVLEGESYDLWAALVLPDTDTRDLARLFAGTHIAALFASDLAESSSFDELETRQSQRVRILRG
jgi:SAM-dependent methyltransferase